MIDLLAFAANIANSNDNSAILVAFLALAGTVLVGYITMRGQRQTAKETVILTKEHAADELIQAANIAMSKENDRLYKVIDRRDAEIAELERELEECKRR
jgi:hypothetical protein